MPKKIITEKTLPLALHELDKWSGKLTWNSFAEQLAKVLGEENISRHTLLSYPALVEAFNDRKQSLKEATKDEEKPKASEEKSEDTKGKGESVVSVAWIADQGDEELGEDGGGENAAE